MEFEFKADFVFNNIEYIVKFDGHYNQAVIEVEQKSNGLIWYKLLNEEFTKKLSQRVGNYK